MQNITAKETAAMLKESGMIVSVDEAEAVPDFLRLMAGIIILNYLKEISYRVDKNES